jgi:hypothetical protein
MPPVGFYLTLVSQGTKSMQSSLKNGVRIRDGYRFVFQVSVICFQPWDSWEASEQFKVQDVWTRGIVGVQA